MPIERICKNCRLYDATNGICGVNVIHEGTYYELPVLPNDPCFWEREDIPVQMVRAWSDGKNGFIEYTDGDDKD